MSGNMGDGPTHCPAANAILAAPLAELRRALGGTLAGCYLYGSAATGDFVDGVSDVDLLPVLTAEMTNACHRLAGGVSLRMRQARPPQSR